MGRRVAHGGAVLALAVALALTACSKSPAEQRAAAEQALAEHRFNDARIALVAALEDAPGDAELLGMLAQTHLERGDGEAALAALERLRRARGGPAAKLDLMEAEAQLLRGQFAAAAALARQHESAEAYRLRALAAIGTGDLGAAEQLFVSGAGRTGTKVRLYADHAIFALRSGQVPAARALVDKALAADGEALDPLIAEGRIASSEGRPRAALAAYEKAAHLYPESQAALFGRIGVLGDLGRIAEAAPLIAQAAAAAPNDPRVIYLQARLQAEKGEWRAVREALQPLERNELPEVRLLYARALLETGLTEQARTILASLIRETPGLLPAQRLLGRAQLAGGEAAAAFATLRPVAARPDASPADLSAFAEAAEKSGNASAAREVFAAIPPAQRLARELAAGDAAIRQQKWRAAIESYGRIRAWTGDSNALVLNNLAYAMGQAGDVDGALPLAEKALALAPDNASILDTAGWLALHQGNRERAADLLRRAAATAPDNPAIRAHLREAEAR